MEGAIEHAMAAMMSAEREGVAVKPHPPHPLHPHPRPPRSQVSSVTHLISLTDRVPSHAQFPAFNSVSEEFDERRRVEGGYEALKGWPANVMHVSSASAFPLRRETRERLSSHNQEQLSRIQLDKEEKRVKMATEALLATEEPNRQEVNNKRVLTAKQKDFIAFYSPCEFDSPEAADRSAALAKKFFISQQEVVDIWKSRKLDTWKSRGTPPMLEGLLFGEDTSLERELTDKNFKINVKKSDVSEGNTDKKRDKQQKGHFKHPKHVLICMKEEHIKRVLCEFGQPPPASCLHVSVIEAQNLPVPHGFASFWNYEGISPFVRVELELHTDDRVETTKLDTSVINQAKMTTFRRTATNPVFYQTCRFENIPPIVDTDVQHVRLLVISNKSLHADVSHLRGRLLFRCKRYVTEHIDLWSDGSR
eukprot:97995-Hanusia_phi.AAC.3